MELTNTNLFFDVDLNQPLNLPSTGEDLKVMNIILQLLLYIKPAETFDKGLAVEAKFESNLISYLMKYYYALDKVNQK